MRTPERTGKNQYAQLVLDALRYAQPVEVGKERSDVVVALPSTDRPRFAAANQYKV